MVDNKSVDDILSSIRDTVSAEQAEDKKAEKIEDVLELTDIVEEAQAASEPAAQPAEEAKKEQGQDEEMVDINAFAESGEVKAADKADVEKAKGTYTGDEQPAETPAEEAAEAPAETPAEETPAAPAEEPPAAEDAAAPAQPVAESVDDIDIDALMNEVAEEAEEAAEAPAEETPAAPAEEPTTAEETEEPLAEQASPSSAPAEEAQNVAAAAADRLVHLATVPSPTGLQVSFPVEVLAEALRPLVSTWVEQNLADIVERLVKEELTKLAEK